MLSILYLSNGKINIRVNYDVRIFTSGCYYLDEIHDKWTSRGIKVVETTYDKTVCLTSHMTLFRYHKI